MSIDILKKQLKGGEPATIYAFYGEEEFLKEYYFNQLKDKVVDSSFRDFNYDVFEGKGIEMEKIQNALESFPVMAERKMLVMKDTGLLKSPKAADKDFWEKVLGDIPSYICLVFYEKEVDQRSKLFGLIKKHGVAVEFKYQKTADLISWVGRIITSYHKKMQKEDITYLLGHCDVGMTSIKNELDKLVFYCGDRDTILRKDIDAVVTKSIESKVFNMIDALMEKNTQQAYELLNDMMLLKEPVTKILALLSKHFTSVLKVKLALEQGTPEIQVAGVMGIAPFIARKYVSQARHFSIEFLHGALKECLNIDAQIKSGKTGDWVMLQTFIAKYGA